MPDLILYLIVTYELDASFNPLYLVNKVLNHTSHFLTFLLNIARQYDSQSLEDIIALRTYKTTRL